MPLGQGFPHDIVAARVRVGRAEDAHPCCCRQFRVLDMTLVVTQSNGHAAPKISTLMTNELFKRDSCRWSSPRRQTEQNALSWARHDVASTPASAKATMISRRFRPRLIVAEKPRLCRVRRMCAAKRAGIRTAPQRLFVANASSCRS